MGRHERSIKIAFDNVSGEILEADVLFKNTKEAFAIRRKFHLDKIELYCCECHQKLNVSTSKYDRLHFKHQVNAEACVLKDGGLSPGEVEEFTRILKTKETQRHKDLKNKIGDRLSRVAGVESSSICIDNRFIIREGDKRRPDVYCVYEGRELVFEIQLAYYYNFGDNRAKQEAFQKINAEARQEAERKKNEELKEEERLEQERLREEQLKKAAKIRFKDIQDKVSALIEWIRQLKDNKSQFYNSVVDSINRLTTEELTYFNSQLKLDKLDKENNPAIHRWIRSAEAADIPFLSFMLSTNKIDIDVNVRSGQDLTVLQHLYLDKAKPVAQGYLMRLILKRGYIVTQEDEVFFEELGKNPHDESTLISYKAAASLNDKSHVDWILDHSKLICILESVKQNKMIGFAYSQSNWIAFANNAIQYYGQYWEYIELAFKFYDLWEKLIRTDKNGSFRKKLETLYADFPQQNFEFDQVIRKLYPQILTQKESEL